MWTLQEYGSRTQWTGCIEIGRPECSAYPDYRKMIQGCIGCNCSSRSLRIPSLMELHTLKLKPSTLTKLSSSSSSSFTLTASGEHLVADLTILLSSLCQVCNSWSQLHWCALCNCVLQICANQVSPRSVRPTSADPLLLRRENLPALIVHAIATAQVERSSFEEILEIS